MARFLITSARAPVALELVRNLAHHGHDVILADSLRYPLAKNSLYASKYIPVAAPATHLRQFKDDLIHCIKSEKIDYLLPTCEEVFYISHFKEQLSSHCNVLCDNFDILSRLHSKYAIMALAEHCEISLPHTQRVSADYLKSHFNQLKDMVVKAEFSRFGLGTLLNISRRKINMFTRLNKGAFILQKKIHGTEYCTYSIAVNGVLTLHSCYQPLHRSAKSAGFYFKPINHEKIKKFVTIFVKKNNYSGQIGFDIIDNGIEIYLIECNPRATSGIHLVAGENLAACLLDPHYQIQQLSSQAAMVSMAMKFIGLPYACITLKLRQWLRDYSNAKDVIYAANDKPFTFYSLLSLLELVNKSVRSGIPLQAASTLDIEWNGEKL